MWKEHKRRLGPTLTLPGGHVEDSLVLQVVCQQMVKYTDTPTGATDRTHSLGQKNSVAYFPSNTLKGRRRVVVVVVAIIVIVAAVAVVIIITVVVVAAEVVVAVQVSVVVVVVGVVVVIIIIIIIIII